MRLQDTASESGTHRALVAVALDLFLVVLAREELLLVLLTRPFDNPLVVNIVEIEDKLLVKALVDILDDGNAEFERVCFDRVCAGLGLLHRCQP